MRLAVLAVVLNLHGSASALSNAVPFAAKVRAACAELGIAQEGSTLPTALAACNEAMGIEASGTTLIQQVDLIMDELGIDVEALLARQPLPIPSPPKPPPPPPKPPSKAPMPRMVVFDLDFTLWRPELYQLSSGPPFTASSDGAVLTRRGERMELFPAARAALRELADAGVPVAIASRASEREWAAEIMRLMRVDDARTMADVIGSAPVVIQGGSKVKHLKHISAESKVPLAEMLFYDNERSNIQEVEKLGVTCAYCPRGMTEEVYREGVHVHVHNRALAAQSEASSGARRGRGGADAGEAPGGASRAGGGGGKKQSKGGGKGRKGGRGR